MPSGSTTLSGSDCLYQPPPHPGRQHGHGGAVPTTLERQWDTETFQALDALEDALRDVEQSDFPYWENIL